MNILKNFESECITQFCLCWLSTKNFEIAVKSASAAHEKVHSTLAPVYFSESKKVFAELFHKLCRDAWFDENIKSLPLYQTDSPLGILPYQQINRPLGKLLHRLRLGVPYTPQFLGHMKRRTPRTVTTAVTSMRQRSIYLQNVHNIINSTPN